MALDDFVQQRGAAAMDSAQKEKCSTFHCSRRSADAE
jgi:hypothetical protein